MKSSNLSLPHVFYSELYAFVVSPIRAACSSRVILSFGKEKAVE
jgi:hypothetical protein